MKLRLKTSLCLMQFSIWLMGLDLVQGRRSRHPNGRRNDLAATEEGSLENQDWCLDCDIRNCPVVTSETCLGTIVKDWCNCCPICKGDEVKPEPITPSSETPQLLSSDVEEVREDIADLSPAFPNSDQSAACSSFVCPRFQLCMLNIQSLPQCRCPTKFLCMKGDRSPVCGEDDITYKSRCFLKMAECEGGKKITMQNKGKCFKSDADRQKKLERLQNKETKKQERLEKKKEKHEKMTKKKLKKKRKQQKLRRERRGRKSTRWNRNRDRYELKWRN